MAFTLNLGCEKRSGWRRLSHPSAVDKTVFEIDFQLPILYSMLLQN